MRPDAVPADFWAATPAEMLYDLLETLPVFTETLAPGRFKLTIRNELRSRGLPVERPRRDT